MLQLRQMEEQPCVQLVDGIVCQVQRFQALGVAGGGEMENGKIRSLNFGLAGCGYVRIWHISTKRTVTFFNQLLASIHGVIFFTILGGSFNVLCGRLVSDIFFWTD